MALYLPQVALDYEAILLRARAAEAAGLHSVWFYDHLYAPGQPGHPSLEGWTLASYVLAQTERLRVGHLVLCNTFRHPALLAKMASTLDVLSGGRLELGLGSGSVQEEHRRAGLPWGSAAERAERLAESLGILTSMLSGGPTTVAGTHYCVEDLPNLPLPVQRPRPPLHIGGVGARRTLPLVARYADVWNVPTYGLGVWRQREEVLVRLCEGIGRDPSSIRRSHEAVLALAPDEQSLPEVRAAAERRYGGPGWGLRDGGYVGTPPMVVDRMAEAIAQGVTFFVLILHDRAAPATIELLAEAVLPALPGPPGPSEYPLTR